LKAFLDAFFHDLLSEGHGGFLQFRFGDGINFKIEGCFVNLRGVDLKPGKEPRISRMTRISKPL